MSEARIVVETNFYLSSQVLDNFQLSKCSEVGNHQEKTLSTLQPYLQYIFFSQVSNGRQLGNNIVTRWLQFGKKIAL